MHVLRGRAATASVGPTPSVVDDIFICFLKHTSVCSKERVVRKDGLRSRNMETGQCRSG